MIRKLFGNKKEKKKTVLSPPGLNKPLQLVFATNNEHKLKEVQAMLPDHIKLLSLKEIGCNEDIPETQPTIEGNALQKAKYVFDTYRHDVFADDTGLEVNALNGEPGVLSARYAGPARDAKENMYKVLYELEKKSDRTARFKTVISLIIDGEEKSFEGLVNGLITEEPRGADGFGYDPIFQSVGENRTFAELSADEKNAISHRARATEKLVQYLNRNF